MSRPLSFEAFTALPRQDRALLVFAQDTDSNPQVGLGALGAGAAHLGAGAGGALLAAAGAFALSPLFFSTLVSAGAAVTASSVLRGLLAIDGVATLEARASKMLHLPPGHPLAGVVYAAHPVEPVSYVPVADFHRLTFQHKVSEAVSLLAHLGAAEIEVEHVLGHGREWAATLSVPGAEGAVDAGASAKGTRESRALFHARYPGHGRPERVEEREWYWLPHEPAWETLVEGRTRFGQEELALTVDYREDFGVNVSLAEKLTGAGLKLGGSFEAHEATSWSMRATFPPVETSGSGG